MITYKNSEEKYLRTRLVWVVSAQKFYYWYNSADDHSAEATKEDIVHCFSNGLHFIASLGDATGYGVFTQTHIGGGKIIYVHSFGSVQFDI